jgi:long-chain acyl-CoA synthetase
LTSVPETIHEAILAAAEAHGDRTALMYRQDGSYVGITYDGLRSAVELAVDRLRSFGLRKGDAVGIASTNRPQWIVADLAVLSLGGIVVPVYPTLPPEHVKHIVNDSGMRMLFVGEARLLEAIAGVRANTPRLEEVILLDDWGVRFGGRARASDDGGRSRARDSAGAEVAASDPATIVYTSGTAGEAKGVVLTHGNIVSNVRGLIERYSIGLDDSAVSYLPLAHMFERTCGHYVFLFAGGTVAYAESLTTLARDVGEVRPTVLIAVPRVLERAYETALAKVERGSLARRGLVKRAFALLNERANRLYQGKRVPLWLAARCLLYDALVASNLRRVAGGRLRLIVSGGAPLDRRTGKILRVLGFGLVEGYGMTETSPVICCGRVEDHRLGTVGKPLRDVEVTIGCSGEILVRGPNVMKGYLNKPDETSAVLDTEGWLHTGDLGEFDDAGNLIVTGRIKDIIVTSYGKNVAPAPIEERIGASPYVDRVVVFGDNRKSLVALIVPNRQQIERHAAERRIAAGSYGALLEHFEIRELLGEQVSRANSLAASYERVVAFHLIAEPFSVENGMLTPTLKLRRSAIAERYAESIDRLYTRLKEEHAR